MEGYGLDEAQDRDEPLGSIKCWGIQEWLSS
jgi:hypothetical protein